MALTAKDSNVDEQCRICMSSLSVATNTNWLNIFNDFEAEQVGLLVIIEEVTGCVVKPDADLPEKVCPLCLSAAKTAFNFKQRFEKSLQLMKQGKALTQEDWTQVRRKESLKIGKSTKKELETYTSEKGASSQCTKTFSQKCKNSHNRKQSCEFSFPKLRPNVQPQTHTAERIFNCSHCLKSFNQKINLESHIRIHTGERPFVCSQCSKTFTHQTSLRLHLRTHTGEKPFECSHCFKKFSTKFSLKTHIHIHTGERPYKCSHCPKTFTHQTSLRLHLRCHTGEKPFECSHCLKKFSQKANLKKHICTHSGEWSNGSPTFSYQASLNNRLETRNTKQS